EIPAAAHKRNTRPPTCRAAAVGANGAMTSTTRQAPRLAWLAVLAVAGLSGCAVWKVGTSVQLARESEPFQAQPAQAAARLLVVGDSTAVGTGA
ncbi:hypothetical protein RSW80_25825, partial [Escherichia coli]|uniref:hypothetical protein n=1 Tax=Escherichia coli TaxID=562 RepID=UPI0028E03AB2